MYEQQREGLGREFIGSVDSTLNQLSRTPLQYAVIHQETRRAMVRRFPYGIFYRVSDGVVTVIAILPLSRDPESWQLRR